MSQIPSEFIEALQDVLDFGARKHGDMNWLECNGSKSSWKDMHASMFRHLASSQAGEVYDDETRLLHVAHLATRALMVYTRIKRDLWHKEDYDDPNAGRAKANLELFDWEQATLEDLGDI